MCAPSSGILFYEAHIFLYEILPEQLREINKLFSMILIYHSFICLNIAITDMNPPSRSHI